MSWSFQLQNGDLSPFGPGGLAVVTGSQKLVQDLRCWLLESVGTDPLHLDYGSNLDGGKSPDGTIIESNIGSVIDKQHLLAIESEVRRVLNAYQEQQVNRLYRDQQALGGKNTFSAGEILYSIQSVQVTTVGDVVVVQVGIQTADGQSVSLTTPVSQPIAG